MYYVKCVGYGFVYVVDMGVWFVVWYEVVIGVIVVVGKDFGCGV